MLQQYIDLAKFIAPAREGDDDAANQIIKLERESRNLPRTGNDDIIVDIFILIGSNEISPSAMARANAMIDYLSKDTKTDFSVYREWYTPA